MSPHAVRTLVAAQLKLELRHPKTGRTSASRAMLTVIAYGFSGLVLALSLGTSSPEHVLFVAGSFGLVLAAFGIAGSYDELMGRPKDNAWLTTLPASEGAQYSARLIGIGLYIGLVAVSVVAPIGARLALAHGVEAGLTVSGLVALSILWTAALTTAFLWTLTLVLPYRALKPVLSATRTLLIAVLVFGYQWIGSQEGGVQAPWWPAAWIADGFAGRPTLGLALLLGSMGVMLGAFAVYFPHRYFRLLSRLADGARSDESRARARRVLSLPERMLVRRPTTRAAYGFALSAFRDDRLVRGRLWPAALLPLGLALFAWWVGGLGDLFYYGAENVLAFPETRLHLSLLVLLLFCGQTLVQTLQFSDHAEAAWLFDTLPDARPRLLQLGAQQALVYRVLLPLHGAIALVLTMWMPILHAVVQASFWFAVVALFTRLYALMQRRPPFARQADRFSAGERFLPLVVSIPAAVGVLVLQTLTFASPALATQATLGLLLMGAGIARLVKQTRTRSVPVQPLGLEPVPAPATF
ncbi:MAG: hypothetical protein HKN04_04935 [Rhodothermaceae bacterium]|nr:hypothetical protein [Rhodothermaceae bacterium]